MSVNRINAKCSLCNLALPGRALRGKRPTNILCESCGEKLRKHCGLCGTDFAPSSLKGLRFSYCLQCARNYSKNYKKHSKTIAGSLSERECLWCLKPFTPPSVRSKCCSHGCNTAHNQFVKHSGEWNRYSKLIVCKCGKLISNQSKYCLACRQAQCSIDGCENIVRSNGLCNTHVIRKRRGMDMNKPQNWRPPRRKSDCSIDGCDRPSNQDDLCLFHLRRRDRGIPLDAPPGYQRPRAPKLCTQAGCERKHHGKGLCNFHYFRKIAGLNLDKPKATKKYTNEICLIENCGRPHAGKGKGLCKTHYRAKYGRKYKNGLHWLPLGDRDGWVCHLCGWVVEQSAGNWKNPNGATVDHLIPRSKGGPDEWDNVRLAHYKCNHKRSDQDLDLLNGNEH